MHSTSNGAMASARRALIPAILSALLFSAVRPAHAQTETVLHSFSDNGRDGHTPVGGLIFDSVGNLYGTSWYGGTYNDGSVFELTHRTHGGWGEKILHSFNGNSADGFGPFANLVIDAAGNLYGTTCFGGTEGGGTVFELTPQESGDWTETVLHNFGSGKDGICPKSGLIFDPAGNLYGTTYQGGAKGAGTVFELTQGTSGAWTEKILHSFDDTGDGGNYPQNGLILDSSGNLYGASNQTVFELTPRATGGWTEKLLYVFNSDGIDGFDPEFVIFGADGNLYGTTYTGGTEGDGTVFELLPKATGRWTEKVLHSFNGEDGVFCYAGLVFDAAGNLYGAVVEGGTYNHGTVFKLTPQEGGNWIETTLHSFDDKDGSYPWNALVLDSAGNLYGTAESGGAFGYGVVFEIKP
jgi:uncharacterized repeat protein (TIGR03803 family)